MDAPLEIPLDDRLCLALHAASRSMDAVYRSLLADVGLTYTQYLAMSALWEEGPLTVGALASRLHLDPSTVSPLVLRLQSRGLLSRERDADDERRVTVVLTAAGEQMRADTAAVPRGVCDAIGLPVDEQADLVAQLKALATALGAER
ncbi:MarR family winged helix-turn-helix transcriptional regulator [Nocardioides sp. Arc9.136]|uniref:MarR family winged helix-turn-helix transcriptional regulator n=1 Tax=Nocardioides sp. Arc9.136 TaxID=2996826 RepID=UPI00266621E5|nr:MarR family transcriptional regulator [Nocardioides sp. Arc9.136]WKN48072.1 MarR family transcriptional regulator [Nocardioides sp. Arc9.136]